MYHISDFGSSFAVKKCMLHAYFLFFSFLHFVAIHILDFQNDADNNVEESETFPLFKMSLMRVQLTLVLNVSCNCMKAFTCNKDFNYSFFHVKNMCNLNMVLFKNILHFKCLYSLIIIIKQVKDANNNVLMKNLQNINCINNYTLRYN